MGMGCFALFISVFYLVGFGLLGYGAWSAWRSTQAANWPTVSANIAQLSVHENSDSEGVTYEVKVLYQYAVDGVNYEGSRLAFGYAGSGSRKSHDEIHQKLKEAKAVRVRYDPANPSESCLSFGINRSIQTILTFAIFWLVFVIGFTLLVCIGSGRDRVLIDNLSVQ